MGKNDKDEDLICPITFLVLTGLAFCLEGAAYVEPLKTFDECVKVVLVLFGVSLWDFFGVAFFYKMSKYNVPKIFSASILTIWVYQTFAAYPFLNQGYFINTILDSIIIAVIDIILVLLFIPSWLERIRLNRALKDIFEDVN